MTEEFPHAMSDGGHQSIVVETYSGKTLPNEWVLSVESEIWSLIGVMFSLMGAK